MPATYAFELYRGDTAQRTVIVWEDTAKTIPADLTDATARAQIRRIPNAPDLLLDLDCTITLPNEIAVSLPASSWPSEFFATGAWDLELSYPDGVVQTILAGPVSVFGDVTQ